MLENSRNGFRQRLVSLLPKWFKAYAKKKALAWITTGKLLGKYLPKWVKPFFKKKGLAWIAPAETFCALGWKHLQINPEGTVKLCCRAGGAITDAQGQPMSLDTHTLAEIWNSDYMKEVRRKMAAGEAVTDCSSCYVEELKTKSSYRTMSNQRWLESDGLTLEEALALAKKNQYPTPQQPVFFQLNLGNLCNLKCRMCSSSFSSQIENDPVHSQWAPRSSCNETGMARWSGSTLSLRPGTARDLVPQGLAVANRADGSAAWVGSSGTFVISLSPTDQVTALEIQLVPGRTFPEVKLSINKAPLFTGLFPAENKLRLDLGGIDLGGNLEIKVECLASSPANSSSKDLAIQEIVLHRTSSSAKRVGSNNVMTTRFDTPGDWHTQDAVLFGEILGDLDHLEELYFTGGEPFINKKFHEMVDHLVRQGVAQRMTLQINSNITKLTDEILEKLRHFRRLTMTLSIDGAGKTYDYIRYPAHWKTVADNARRFLQLPNASILAMPVISLYNALTITELYRFCEEANLPYAFQPCGGPDWLMLKTMPPAGLELAAKRCLDFAVHEAREKNRPKLEALAEHLLSHRPWHVPELLPVFNEFTHDLDASRNQNFAETFPELVQILAESGYQWASQPKNTKLIQIGLPSRKAS
jgi:MoaA/NifB/PqqE/SkfB family radical SAM enzyme